MCGPVLKTNGPVPVRNPQVGDRYFIEFIVVIFKGVAGNIQTYPKDLALDADITMVLTGSPMHI